MKKILVIDDDSDLLNTLKSLLEKHGYMVAVSESCEESLQVLRSFKPDLILLDVHMKNEDGRDLCKKIKALSEFRLIPVILISANHESIAFYPDYGAEAALKKPFEAGVLLEALKRFL